MSIKKLTPGEQAIASAYEEDIPVKAQCSTVSCWIDDDTVQAIRYYAERLGLKYSELYRGIFLAGMPNADEVEEQLKKFGKKFRDPTAIRPKTSKKSK